MFFSFSARCHGTIFSFSLKAGEGKISTGRDTITPLPLSISPSPGNSAQGLGSEAKNTGLFSHLLSHLGTHSVHTHTHTYTSLSVLRKPLGSRKEGKDRGGRHYLSLLPLLFLYSRFIKIITPDMAACGHGLFSGSVLFCLGFFLFLFVFSSF